LGLAPSINEGDEFSIANVAGGSAPDIAGKNIANPCAMILSLEMLLEWLGTKFSDLNMVKLALNIDEAVKKVLNEGNVLTPELNGRATTKEMTAEICEHFE
jgi:3-isopropylmalate dehydrogenase